VDADARIGERIETSAIREPLVGDDDFAFQLDDVDPIHGLRDELEMGSAAEADGGDARRLRSHERRQRAEPVNRSIPGPRDRLLVDQGFGKSVRPDPPHPRTGLRDDDRGRAAHGVPERPRVVSPAPIVSRAEASLGTDHKLTASAREALEELRNSR